MPSQTVPVTPKVIRWARERRKITDHEAARLMKVSVETLREWETKPSGLKVSQIQRMAKVYHVPHLLLLQQTIPNVSGPPNDFRTEGGKARELTLPTLLAIDEARRVQLVTSDLLEDLPELRQSAVPQHSQSDSAEETASIDRELFGLPIEAQVDPISALRSFERWRTRVQNTGVLVLVENINRDECRGFSFHSGGAPTIVISKDYREPPQAMTFTLFHEYAHLTLSQDAMCLERSIQPERWCNDYAGALLVPSDRLRMEINLRPGAYITSTKQVLKLATKFKVSRHVMALRLIALQMGTQELYEQVRAEDNQRRKLLEEIQASKEQEEQKKGGPDSHVRRLAEVGVRFAGVVLTALDRGAISQQDASEYLDVSPDRLELLARDMTKKMDAYG